MPGARDSEPAARRRRRRGARVELGRAHPDGVAASLFGLLQSGVARRPELAARTHGSVLVRFREDYLPVRIVFGSRAIKVADGEIRVPDVVITGRLGDVINLVTAPLWRGVPKLTDRRGRRAIAHVASRRVRITGDRALARSLLALLEL